MPEPEQAIASPLNSAEKIAKGASCSQGARTTTSPLRQRRRTRSGDRTRSRCTATGRWPSRKIGPPVLIVYGLIGRYTMADLQEDRSLVRNLLKLGVDLYVDRLGPSLPRRPLADPRRLYRRLSRRLRATRWPRGTGPIKVKLLGICEGGVFTACYAALHPERSRISCSPSRRSTSMATWREPPRPRLHQRLDTEPRRRGHRPADRRARQSARRVHGLGLLDDDADAARSLKYNLDLLEVMDDENKLLNFLRMEKWLADRPNHPGEAAKQWLNDLYQQNKLIEGRIRARRSQGRSRQHHDARCSTSSPRTTTSFRRRPRKR